MLLTRPNDSACHTLSTLSSPQLTTVLPSPESARPMTFPVWSSMVCSSCSVLVFHTLMVESHEPLQSSPPLCTMRHTHPAWPDRTRKHVHGPSCFGAQTRMHASPA